MRFACFIAALLWLAPAAGAQNQVLDLDGKDSFVELPPDSFKALDEATIEAWVKWENVRGYGRLFNCGQKRSDFSIALLNGLDLWLVLVDDQSRNQELIVSAIVKPRAWCHLPPSLATKDETLFRWHAGRHPEFHGQLSMLKSGLRIIWAKRFQTGFRPRLSRADR